MTRRWFFLVLLNFLFLRNTTIDLLSDLSQLQLSPEYHVLLLLQGSLGLLKGGLELTLLNLEPPALFVQLVDGATAVSELVEQILDLVGRILVLPLDNVQLFCGLIASSLQAEQLRVVVAALVLRGLDLSRDVGGLGLPLAQDLVKVASPLLSDDGGSVGPLVLHRDLVQVGQKPGLGLLDVGHLGLESVHSLLGLDDLGRDLGPVGLELVHPAHALGLVARPPQLDLGLGLGVGLEGVRLGKMLILDLFPQVLQVGGSSLVLGEEGGAVLGLGVGQSLGVLELGGQRDLLLVGVGDGSLQLVDLPVEVGVLGSQPLLGRVGLVQSAGHLVQLGVGVYDGSLEQLASLVQLGLALNGVL